MSARDLERLDHTADDFLAEEAESAAQVPDARSGRHRFLASPNPRQRNCVRCGRPASAHLSAELQRATAIGHFHRAIQRTSENDVPSARLEAEAALRILGGPE